MIMKNALFLLTILFTISSFSQVSRKASNLNLENKIAIQGYDPVAYFKQNQAIKGKKELTTNYLGATYYFTSKENKDTFLTPQSNYEPQ